MREREQFCKSLNEFLDKVIGIKRITDNQKDNFYKFCSYLNKDVRKFTNGNLQRKNIQVFFPVFKQIIEKRVKIDNVKVLPMIKEIQNNIYQKPTNNVSYSRTNTAYYYLPVFEKYNLFGENCYFFNYPNCKCKLIRDNNTKGFSFLYKGEKLTGSQCCREMAKDCHCLKNSKTYQFSQYIIVEKSGRKIIDYYNDR